jgi:hypothetical protein
MMITKKHRRLLPQERDFLKYATTEQSEQQWFGCGINDLMSVDSVVEFTLQINRILRPERNNRNIPVSKQLYVVEVSNNIIMGFELCFMDHTYVVGQFPKQRVAVSFGLSTVRPGGECDGGINTWPVSFNWHGACMEIIDIPELEALQREICVPMYRLSTFEEAMDRSLS